MAMIPQMNVASSAGPSGSTADGAMRDMGFMSVGDFYASGSRVRKTEGIDWKILAIVGAVAVVGLKVWKS